LKSARRKRSNLSTSFLKAIQIKSHESDFQSSLIKINKQGYGLARKGHENAVFDLIINVVFGYLSLFAVQEIHQDFEDKALPL